MVEAHAIPTVQRVKDGVTYRTIMFDIGRADISGHSPTAVDAICNAIEEGLLALGELEECQSELNASEQRNTELMDEVEELQREVDSHA
tara:strand:+ start:276 stop:542 length:267 start_codon:yes stop_codon:yes gene_type:complete